MVERYRKRGKLGQIDAVGAITPDFGRNPSSDTVVYYPFTSSTTVNDMKGVGTAYNLTNSGGVSFGTYQGVNCAHFTSGGGSSGSKGLYRNTSETIFQSGNNYTFSVRLYKGDENMYYNPRIVGMYANPIFTYAGLSRISVRDNTSYGIAPDTGKWFLFTCICTGGSTRAYYKNAVLQNTQSATLTGRGNGIVLGTRDNLGTGYGDKRSGGMSEMIIEKKLRSTTDLTKYFNKMKSRYGLN